MFYTYILLHGSRNSGHNPSHKPKGFQQISHLSDLMLGLDLHSDKPDRPLKVKLIGVGRSKRCEEIYNQIRLAFPHVKKVVSPILGFEDSKDDSSGMVVIGKDANGNDEKIPSNDYIPLDAIVSEEAAWKFMKRLQKKVNGDIICCASRLICDLLRRPSKSGSIYEVDPQKKTMTPLEESIAVGESITDTNVMKAVVEVLLGGNTKSQ